LGSFGAVRVKMIAPIVENLQQSTKANLKIGKGDVDNHHRSLCNTASEGIPTLSFSRTEKVVEQIVGAAPKKSLVDKLTKH